MQRVNARTPLQTHRRRAVVTVEVALCVPIFIVFLAGLMEFSHVFLVTHMLNSACRQGAHLGCFEGVTSKEVEARVKQIVEAAINSSKATVIVRDASVFDDSQVDAKSVDFTALPSIDLTQADSGDPFVVQVSVPYDTVALLPPFWVQDHIVTGRAVMRHE